MSYSPVSQSIVDVRPTDRPTGSQRPFSVSSYGNVRSHFGRQLESILLVRGQADADRPYPRNTDLDNGVATQSERLFLVKLYRDGRIVITPV